MAKKPSTDKFTLASVLIDLHYFAKSSNKAAVEKLKKSRHVTAAGKISKRGEEFISKYYARGSDRETLMKELG